jgi:hypothetical protein
MGADHVAMILSPASQDGVEPLYKVAGRQMSGASYDTSDLPYDRVHAGLGRLDQQLISVHADVLSEEVKPLFNMCDDRLIRRELETSFSQESFHEGTDLLFKHLARSTVIMKSSQYLTRFTFWRARTGK